MTPEQKAAFVMAQAACAIALTHSLHAANLVSVGAGKGLVHGPEAFEALINQHQIGWNDVISFLQN